MNRIIFFIGLSFFFVVSCAKDKVGGEDIDAELFSLAKKTDNVTYYMNSTDNLARSSGSGHSQPFLRTRYNSIAATQLDANGKIVANTTFSEGSLIIKELINSAGSIDRFAVLLKRANDKNADANGWIWGYIDFDGKVASSAKEKGGSCINCHSQSESIDYMLMNKYFP